MLRTIGELVDELMERLNDNTALEAQDSVMLNVAGRWTGVKGLTWDARTGVLLIESED